MMHALDRFVTSTVLVVDDEPLNLALARALLEEAGAVRVITEADPRRVEALLPEIDPDLVLLDLHMPHLDGYAVLQQIVRFAAGAYLPVLVLTADATTDARDRALTAGAHDFLTKPLDGIEVVLRAANLLQTREMFRTLRLTRTGPVPAGTEAERTEASQRIADVIERGRWVPVYQPIVDIESGGIVGHEALARFDEPHPSGPAGWFADAFAVGRGVDLEWAAIIRALPFLDSADDDAFLALNASPATVLHLDEETLCPPALCPRVVVELTEHELVEDYGAIRRAFAPMRAHGARLAADDIGSRYAGLRHLLALGPDIIKLDIALVAGIHKNPSARALVRAMIAFAGDVGATVIAEGVEQPDELAALRDLGVTWVQGYLVGRPAPPLGIASESTDSMGPSRRSAR